VRSVRAVRHHGDQGEQPDHGAGERPKEETAKCSPLCSVGRRGHAEETAVRVRLVGQVVMHAEDKCAQEPATEERYEEQERPLEASWSSPLLSGSWTRHRPDRRPLLREMESCRLVDAAAGRVYRGK
jgi:hypothetical protein